MTLADDAFSSLFPERQPERRMTIKYSGKFSSYNANVKYNREKMEFHLSRAWEEVSPDIQIGLIQSLLLKIFKEKRETLNLDLYNIFMKKLSSSAPRTVAEPDLVASFERVNARYFNGSIEMPNLIWGQESERKLGSYAYGSDTVSMSSILKDRPHLIDYVMHHELLHKLLKYSSKNGRSLHHSRLFRAREAEFEGRVECEREIAQLIQSNRSRGGSIFSRWF
jgi:hypothetical protein